MSDFIPMISSSPPPLDDTASFDDWGNDDGDDDFGGFATAHVPVQTPSNEKLELSSNQTTSDSISANHADDLAASELPDCETGFVDKHVSNVPNSMSEISPAADSDGFGHFATTIPPDTIGPFSDSTATEIVLKKTADAIAKGDEKLAQQHNICQSDIAKSIQTCQDDCCSPQSQHCSQAKVSRDSGICSSEISPVTKSDDYQEFTHSEYDINQFSASQSSDGLAATVDRTDVTVAAAEDVADNGFGSGTTSPNIEPQVETDCEPVNAHLPEYVPLSDCVKGAICGDISTESTTTYQDVSAKIRGETVISQTDQLEVKGTAGSDCDRDTHEHSSNLECGDSATVAESTLKMDVNCVSEHRTDRVVTDGIPESNIEFCSGDSAVSPESTSPEHPECGNESETDSVEHQPKQTSCKPPDDEDDDFSNFSTAAEMQNVDTESEINNQQAQASCVLQDDEDDGFGNFGVAPDGQNDENEFDAFSGFKDSGTPSGESDWAAFHSGDLPRASEEDLGDDWAAFHGSGAQTRTASAGGEKEDDFGDFEKAEFGSFAQKPPSSVSVKPVPVDVRARMETILVQCFPPLQGTVDTDDVSPCLLIEVVTTELRRPLSEHRLTAGRHKAPPAGTVDLNVWNRLKDIEETAALKYTWAASATSRQLLAAIAVDPRNMLLPHKKQSMPAFAADLGLLEPSRGSHREPTMSCDPVIIDTSKSPPPTATDPAPDIPPAEFDWNSSGLTNPLDARGCMPLDLDFLVIHGHHGNSDVTVMQSEALQKEQEILEAIETVSPSSAVKTLQPLESVLAKMKFVSSVTTSKRDQSNLTEDAARVIQRLPDLSFMHASVLMFPIKGDQ
ncbi:hypothetical protein NP493_164g02049 [Ridgeia piscesae]|uniref:Aftiphilin clathrin-binding box domain-containing protein n=1 Tax=Ridgeia piscesae TaxID=27915 RepID=A0AAD9UFK0_RIDPI|nr:hypothetical protein NP493_164g02049 [Ridgeia piscesae]